MNRFTEELLSLDTDNEHIFRRLITEAGKIIGVPGIYRECEALDSTNNFKEHMNIKITFVCFLATMSDEDLKELFGI